MNIKCCLFAPYTVHKSRCSFVQVFSSSNIRFMTKKLSALDLGEEQFKIGRASPRQRKYSWYSIISVTTASKREVIYGLLERTLF